MPIPIISNFSVNVTEPIDTRMVATGPDGLTNMLYKYNGLTTYRSDEDLNYTYRDGFWQVTSNGIYGGSGKLRISNTEVNFGTLSTTQGSESKTLTYYSNTRNDGGNSLKMSESFIRHTDDGGGSNTTGQFKSQLIFSNPGDAEEFPGPYIIMNPAIENQNSYGGISFASYTNVNGTVHERLRIEGNGLIRFKPHSVVSVSTKSINIGIDSADLKPYIGYNWKINTAESSSSDLASYIEFNDSTISINYYNGVSATHSAIFSPNTLTINGGVIATGGTISTNKNISFGAFDGGVHRVATPTNFGMRYDASKGYAELISSGIGGAISNLRWGPSSGNQPTVHFLVPTVFTYSFYNVNLFASTIRSEFKSQMWDNVFNPDYKREGTVGTQPAWKTQGSFSDLNFQRSTDPLESKKNEANESGTPLSGHIYIAPIGLPSVIDARTTAEFVIRIGTSYTLASNTLAENALTESAVSKTTFFITHRDYDRIYYFYSDGYKLQIPHQVRWWLGEQTSTPDSYRYVQVGNIETGNKANYNNSTTSNFSYFPNTANTGDYQSRFYSQCVFVPAGMAFKIQFRFHVSFNIGSVTSDGAFPRIFFNVIRSGKFRQLPYIAPTTPTAVTTLGYPGIGAGG